MDEEARSGPWTEEQHHRFTISYALKQAFRLARGVRKQVTEQERDLVAKEILAHLELCGMRITRDAEHRPRHSVECQVPDAAPLRRPDATG